MSGFDYQEPRFETEDMSARTVPSRPLNLGEAARPMAPAAAPSPEHGMAPAPVQDTEAVQPNPRATPVKRPRVALMGEFSAGKSTLSNLLIGKSALPVNVTATQLPPVWLSYGDDTPYRVDLDGEEFDIDFDRLTDVSVSDTSHIRVSSDAKFLEMCDLIDMPGISDPNMAADVWQRVIHNADIVIWCSHATQAWRQSEAAVWSTMPSELYEKSILLLTRMDKILSERDRKRVIRRVEKETEGLFKTVLPVSLIKALDASDDSEAWIESGADALMAALVDLVGEVNTSSSSRPKSRRIRSTIAPGNVEDSLGEEVAVKPARIVMPTRVRPRPLGSRADLD